MKKLIRVLASVMALLMALSIMTFALAEEEEGELSGGRMPIGSTPYSIQVPAGYYDAGVTEDDIADMMISTYVADDSDLAFDVYEFEKSEEYPDVETFMTKDCAAYNGTELTLDGVINGVKVASYRSNDEYNGVIYNDINYAFEYGNKIVQIDFYWLNAAVEGMAEQIMSTFSRNDLQQISIGLSNYSIMIPAEFVETELGTEDYEAGQLLALSNHYTGLEIETYYFNNEAGISLQDAAKAQAEAYNGVILEETEINGIPMAGYVATQTYDNVEYNVFVVLVENENGGFSAITFYLNNFCAHVQANAYIYTLGVYDELKNVSIKPMDLQLGSSGYKVTLPNGFVSGSIAREEFDEDGLIGVYSSPYSDITFDLYQCSKAAEESDQLAGFTEIDAAKFDGTEIDLEGEINGIPVTCYRSVETYDDITYQCLNYTFEAQDFYFVQLCFYWQGEDLTADVEQIMSTLAPAETKEVVFANGDFTMTVAADTEVNELDEETDGFYAVYCSSASGAPYVCMYNVENPDKLSMTDYVTAEAATFEGLDLNFGENGNGVTLGSYRISYTEPDSDDLFAVFMVFCEKDGKISESNIIIRDYAQYMQAVEMISSIKAA